MFAITISEKGGESKRLEFDKSEITIGRVQGNDIILPKGNVSKRHSRIVLKDGKFIIVDLKSTNGTYVNGRKITSPIVIKGTDKVYIGDFVLSVEDQASEPQTDLPPPLPPPAPRRATVPPPPPARRAGPEQRTMGLAAVDPGDDIAPPVMPDDPPALNAADEEEEMPSAPPPVEEPPPAPEPVREPPRVEPPRVESPRPNRTLAPSALPPRPAPRPTVMGDPGARPIRDAGAQPAAQPAGGAAAARPAPLPTRSPPAATPSAPPPAATRERQPSVPAVPAVRRETKEAPATPEPPAAPPQRAPERLADRPASSDRIPAMGRAVVPVVEAAAAAPDRGRAVDALKQIVNRLAAKLNLDGMSREQLAEAPLWQRAERLAGDFANELGSQLPAGLAGHTLAHAAVAEALGTGPFEALLADHGVTEISVPRFDRVLAVRDGERTLTDQFFSTPDAVVRAVARLSNGASPHKGIVEARLDGGVQLTAVVEPLVARGAVVTLRRPRAEAPTLEGLAAEGMLSSQMAEFLSLAVQDRRNILVTGAATSGRATVVAALAHGAGDSEHVVLIEDREHESPAGSSVARLTTRAGARETLAAALRLHPDRLVVDDSHGQAAAAALEAMVGLPGTIASSPGTNGADGVSRFLAQARLAPGAPDAELLREALADHLHLVIHVARGADKRTRVTQIAEVERIDGRGRAALAEVFAWKGTASGGDFTATGHVPTFAEGAAPSMFKN